MSVQIIHGDSRAALEYMPSQSVHCIVTSPPYWGLRDYGTGHWVGGNDPSCDHKTDVARVTAHHVTTSGLEGGKATQLAAAMHKTRPQDGSCEKCGASRVDQQIGLEASVAEHMAVLVDLFREARRVLRDDGTLWLNYGDAYASSPNGRSAADTKSAGNDDRTFRDKPISTVGGVFKPKDRMLLPARLAIALQEDGWWIRDEIVWHKPNPMPSSVKDRTTPAHEMIYMLSKSPRYYFDQEAIREEANVKDWNDGTRVYGGVNKAGANAKHGERTTGRRTGQPKKPRGAPPRHAQYSSSDQSGLDDVGRGEGRNKRSVWTVPPKGFKEAHFATFPPDLIRPCILAGCPVGGTVLDPFFGAGTTGLVAQQHGRNSIGIELNAEYIDIAKRRLGLIAAKSHEGVFV